MGTADKSSCGVCGQSVKEQKTEIVDIAYKTRRCYECQRLLDKDRARKSA